MTKRKMRSPSRHARRPKIAAQAQRANQAIVKSPKEGRPRQVAAGSTESPPKRKQEASLADNPMTAFQDDNKQTMKDIVSSKGFDFPSATANVRAYQAKLAEVAQANVQFVFEYAQRLATIRSPVEILNVIAEFTSKRIAMFQRHLIEMAELSTKR
jgi:outer membrane protein OmpA-like peptidoglycan-associated protein